MTAVRLRPKWTDEQLAEIYRLPHNHFIYGRGHNERVESMIKIGAANIDTPIISVADLSCGNAHAVNRLMTHFDATDIHVGDIAPGYPYHGPLEETLYQIPAVSLYVCGETLEHLDDPLAVLKLIRTKTRYLIVSTPTDNWGDTNAEHYWSWSQEDVEEMFMDAGFRILNTDVVDSRTWGEPYRYGIWLCN